jgi:hypothetical protein
MPDPANVGTGLHNLAIKTLLAKLVHQVDSTESSANNQDISLELFGIVAIVTRSRLVGRSNIGSEMNHGVDMCGGIQESTEYFGHQLTDTVGCLLILYTSTYDLPLIGSRGQGDLHAISTSAAKSCLTATRHRVHELPNWSWSRNQQHSSPFPSAGGPDHPYGQRHVYVAQRVRARTPSVDTPRSKHAMLIAAIRMLSAPLPW